jgi:DNA-binding CsgD family transcriptional regulator
VAFDDGQGLSAMEIVIADLAGRDMRDDEIARDLGLEPATVTRYLSRICRKLGIQSRLELGRPARAEERNSK